VSEYADQVWQWICEPLRQLKDDYRSQPDSTWDERLPRFVDQLGIQSVESHPIVDRLARHVRETFSSDAERARFVTGDEIDTLVYRWSDDLATESAVYVDQSEPLGDPQQTATPEPAAPPREPADLADEVATKVALPIVLELASAAPTAIDGVSPDELIEILARLLAEELAAAGAR
jgi:hypothetical protein